MKKYYYFVIIDEDSGAPFFSGQLDPYDLKDGTVHDKIDAWQREPLSITLLNDLEVANKWKTALQLGFPDTKLSIRPVTLDIKGLPRL